MVKAEELLIPSGWKNAFGQMLCDELNAIGNFKVLEAKEKWGELSLTLDKYNERAEDIIEKYTTLSRHICIGCGKPDVPMCNYGWVSPVCKDCWSEYGSKPYDDCCSNVWEMPKEMIIRRYDPQWKDICIKRINISKTADAIRRNYADKRT